MNGRYEDVMMELRRMFPDAMLINVKQMAKVRNEKAKTIYNRLSLGTYPVKTFRRRGKPRWLITEVARYLAEESKSN